MTTLYNEETTVQVSYFDEDGWWSGNGEESVLVGMSLPALCTANVFIPTDNAHTGRYVDGMWLEYKDLRGAHYWDVDGNEYVITSRLEDFPDGAVLVDPPAYDRETQHIHFDGTHWDIYENLIGQTYWMQVGDDVCEYTVHERLFKLPARSTLTAPPHVEKYHALQINGEGEYYTVEDYRGQIAYLKSGGGSYQIDHLGPPKADYTLLEPQQFDVWDETQWVYSQELADEFKSNEERIWRDEQLEWCDHEVNRITDASFAGIEYTAAASESELRAYRLALRDYPQKDGFPHCDRPSLM